MTKPAHILLVEDSRMDVELTFDAFRQSRLSNTIFVVRNGEEAIDYVLGRQMFSDRDQYPLPDLILLDLNLPGISGHDVLQVIKETPHIKRIPVVILTSSNEDSDCILGYDLGANSYLVKPVSFEGFVKVISQIGEYWLTLNVAPPE